MIELKPVHTFPNEVAFPFLYELLKERDDTVNVHHQELPSYEAHVAFCLRHGMTGQWWIVMAGNEMAGMVSCTGGKGGSDVGVFILKKFQGKGYGEAAMRAMMALRDPHQKHLAELRVGMGPYHATINAKNKRSIAMFEKLGFKPKYHVYELDIA